MSPWLLLSLLAWQTPDYLEQGRKALDAQKNEEAAALFQKAVDAEPKDYAAHFHLALAASLLRHDEQATAEYRRTLELKPNLYEADLNLGIILLRGKLGADAVPFLEAAVLQKPAEYRPNYYLAEALAQTGNAEQARAHFETALKADPKSAAAELGLARTLVAQNQLTTADPHFRAAASLDPNYREALLELAAAEEKAGHAPEAIAIYKEFPGNPSAQARLGELLLENKQFADAIPRLEKAVADTPTVANRLALATAYRMNKQPEKQDEQLDRAVATEPGNFDLRMIYGRQLRDERKLTPAADQFLAAAKLKPDSKEAWNELASARIVHGDYAQGLAALDRLKALGAESPGNLFFRAITLDKLHQNPLALDSYKQFLAVSGGKFPDEEFQARQRVRIIETEMHKR